MNTKINGSPPHTRERLDLCLILRDSGRITPAYAGKTGVEAGALSLVGDHPRIRGKDT